MNLHTCLYNNYIYIFIYIHIYTACELRVMMSTLTVHCPCEEHVTRESSGHPHLYAETKKHDVADTYANDWQSGRVLE